LNDFFGCREKFNVNINRIKKERLWKVVAEESYNIYINI